MAGHNVNLTIASENDGTTRDNVPDWLVHMTATWTDEEGQVHEFSQDRYLLVQINWLIENHPQAARRQLQRLVYQIEMVRRGIDEVNVL
jgi:hypothetical protein